jgi:hypothetical protein
MNTYMQPVILAYFSLLDYVGQIPLLTESGKGLFFFTPWSESASELYRQSDRRLSAKLMPTFEDRRCHVIIIGFLDRSRYFYIK